MVTGVIPTFSYSPLEHLIAELWQLTKRKFKPDASDTGSPGGLKGKKGWFDSRQLLWELTCRNHKNERKTQRTGPLLQDGEKQTSLSDMHLYGAIAWDYYCVLGGTSDILQGRCVSLKEQSKKQGESGGGPNGWRWSKFYLPGIKWVSPGDVTDSKETTVSNTILYISRDYKPWDFSHHWNKIYMYGEATRFIAVITLLHTTMLYYTTYVELLQNTSQKLI